MKERNKLMLIAAGFLILGMLIGYGMGVKAGITWAVKIGLNFVEIDVDEAALTQAIFQYKNRINECYAPIYDYPRNQT